MKVAPNNPQTENAVLLDIVREPLVAAPAVAKRFSVTSRYILQLADAGRIPCHRLGRKCVRFDLKKVEAALGVEGGAA